jgi:hypothetical protein
MHHRAHYGVRSTSEAKIGVALSVLSTLSWTILPEDGLVQGLEWV